MLLSILCTGILIPAVQQLKGVCTLAQKKPEPWGVRPQPKTQATDAELPAKDFRTRNIIISLPEDLIEDINEEVNRLRKAYQNEKPNDQTIARAMEIARAQGVAAANCFLAEAKKRLNPFGKSRVPSRTSLVEHLLKLGYEAYKKQPTTPATAS
jgi:hypothetical protein